MPRGAARRLEGSSMTRRQLTGGTVFLAAAFGATGLGAIYIRVETERVPVARLVENEQSLRTMEALQTANASLLRPASGAAQIQPRTKRATVLGVMLGLMLGIGLAFVRDALDTRVRSSTEIADRLDTTPCQEPPVTLPTLRVSLVVTNSFLFMSQ